MRCSARRRVVGFPSSKRRPGLGGFCGRGLRLDACILEGGGYRVGRGLSLILLCGCRSAFVCSRDDDRDGC